MQGQLDSGEFLIVNRFRDVLLFPVFISHCCFFVLLFAIDTHCTMSHGIHDKNNTPLPSLERRLIKVDRIYIYKYIYIHVNVSNGNWLTSTTYSGSNLWGPRGSMCGIIEVR